MVTCQSVGSRVSVMMAGAVLTAMAAGPAAAQTLAPLEQAVKVAATTAASATPAAGEPQAPAAPAENPVLTFFKGTELMGFVDTYYSYNFNTPKTSCATVGGVAIFNCLHNFDVAHNSFSLNLGELALEKKPTTESRGGYRIDLDYGSAAAIVAGFDPGGTTYQNIQQAYVSYLAPAGKGTMQWDFGKFVTPAGNEVIETKDNWNYSRSLLFALAIPYYHMGMRAAYSPNDKVTVTGFLFNGWNNSVDNNGGKSVGLSVTGKPNGNLTIIENYIGGPETTGDNTGWRHLSDTVVTYTVDKMSSVALNYDFGKDQNSNQTWQGVALYYKYQANDWFAIVPRYEYLKDKDGFMSGASQNLQEFTLTAELKHKDGVMMRVEYRGDFSNLDGGYFLKNTGELVKNQNALTVGWVYAFSSKTP
jgi:hypothetical protein